MLRDFSQKFLRNVLWLFFLEIIPTVFSDDHLKVHPEVPQSVLQAVDLGILPRVPLGIHSIFIFRLIHVRITNPDIFPGILKILSEILRYFLEILSEISLKILPAVPLGISARRNLSEGKNSAKSSYGNSSEHCWRNSFGGCSEILSEKFLRKRFRKVLGDFFREFLLMFFQKLLRECFHVNSFRSSFFEFSKKFILVFSKSSSENCSQSTF